jgi:hypothetical protein
MKKSNLKVYLPRYVNTIVTRQTFHTQHFVIVIKKATCFDCTRQPSSGFTFQKYKKRNHLVVAAYNSKILVQILHLCNICYVFRQSIRDCFGGCLDITTETLMILRLQPTKVTIRTQNLATQNSQYLLMESPFIESQMHLVRSVLWRKKGGKRHKVKNLV